MTIGDHLLEDRPKPFLQHLEELRRTILWSLAIFVVGVLIAIPLTPRIFNWLRAPLAKVTDHPEQFLRSLEITGGFSIAMQIVLWSGVIFSAPFWGVLVARFVFPGLMPRERRAIMGASLFAVGLFVFGVALGYFITLPVALKVMLGLHAWLGIQAEWTVTSYVTFAMHLLLAFGLAFELPVVVLALGYVGVISSQFLRHYRRHAIVVILIIAMIMTPGPDIFSQLIMGLPMILLYEFCVWVIWGFERRRPQT